MVVLIVPSGLTERSVVRVPPFGPVAVASTAPSAPLVLATVDVLPWGPVLTALVVPSGFFDRSIVATPPLGPVTVLSTAPSAPRERATVDVLP
jgi:hypothetical protein